ncbi:Protein tilB [Blattella germanica]|nr:Protein tilB [Blattella germanica]
MCLIYFIVTEELVRKRAEHNEREITTLEEISLHQENIDKLDCLDKWCRDLKILLLQSNLISKIALNNVERVENLEGCESLQKLDLTVNFIGELSSIKSLKNNIYLESLFLTGNPCTDFKGYRQYVVGTLPQLKCLDGREIERSERILAMQEYEEVKQLILHQEEEYKVKRQIQKEQAKKQIEEEDAQFASSSNKSEEERQREEKTENNDPTKPPKRTYKLFSNNGIPLNVNEAKIPFQLSEDEETNSLVLDIAIYRYLDTSLLDVDIHPTYVKVLIKGKIFQIVFNEEIKTESSTAKRSQTTGHLVLTMPKVNGEVKLIPKAKSIPTQNEETDFKHNSNSKRRELLEIGRSDDMDFSKIVEINERNRHKKTSHKEDRKLAPLSFKDNPEVPPLE